MMEAKINEYDFIIEHLTFILSKYIINKAFKKAVSTMQKRTNYSKMGELEFLVCFQNTFSAVSRLAAGMLECSDREKNILFESKEIVDELYRELGSL